MVSRESVAVVVDESAKEIKKRREIVRSRLLVASLYSICNHVGISRGHGSDCTDS